MSAHPFHVSESVLSSVIDNLTTAIILVDRDRRVLIANQLVRQIGSRSDPDLIGKRGGEVLGCVNADRSPGGCGFDPQCAFCSVRKLVDETFAGKTANAFVPAEMEVVREGRRHLRVSTKYLLFGQTESVLVSLEDVTDMLLRERLRLENAQLRSAVETAGAVCHEVNNPLMIVSGYLQIVLSEWPETDEHYDHLLKIKYGVDRIEHITRKLMNIEAYKIKGYAENGRILDLENASSGDAPSIKAAS